jgi:hypothetical protein
MMAPDRNTLASFCIVNDDVIHAVLTTIIQPSGGGRRGGIVGSSSGSGSGQITRRGQQARMLHRMNSNSNSNTSGRVGEGGGIPSLWRRTGIDYNGIVVPSRDMTSNNNNDDDDSTSSSEEDDDEEYNDIAVAGEIEGNDCNGGRSSRRRRPRERRGFDRLRAVSLYIFFYGGGEESSP